MHRAQPLTPQLLHRPTRTIQGPENGNRPHSPLYMSEILRGCVLTLRRTRLPPPTHPTSMLRSTGRRPHNHFLRPTHQMHNHSILEWCSTILQFIPRISRRLLSSSGSKHSRSRPLCRLRIEPTSRRCSRRGTLSSTRRRSPHNSLVRRLRYPPLKFHITVSHHLRGRTSGLHCRARRLVLVPPCLRSRALLT